MTKAEAAEKVAKLLRLAEKAGTPAEAESARRNAKRLIDLHHLTTAELSMGSRAAAFDDLMDELDAYVSKQPVPAVVREVIDRVRKDTKKEDKSDALGKFVVGLRAAALFVNVGGIKSTVEEVLKKHGVTI